MGEKHNVEVILCIHYLICMLLPVLKQINVNQSDELEIEARIKGNVMTIVILSIQYIIHIDHFSHILFYDRNKTK